MVGDIAYLNVAEMFASHHDLHREVCAVPANGILVIIHPATCCDLGIDLNT